MNFIDSDLVDSVKKIGPMLREQGELAEKKRRLPGSILEALADAGYQRMSTPRAFGGLEVNPVTCARVFEEVGLYDSAAAWALQAGNSGAWWAARLPKEGSEEIYGSNPSTLVAAAFHPPQRAVPVDGGYRITGRGPLSSNIHDSQWLFLTAMIMEGDQPKMTNGQPEIIGLYLRAEEVEIIDTWDSLGMRATDSNDVALQNVFVPTSRTFPLVPEFEPSPAFDGPLYRFPGIGQVIVIVAPVTLAIARGAINELRDLALKKTPFGFMKTLKERSVAQVTLAQAEGILRSARALCYDTLSEAWDRTLKGEPFTLAQRADLLLAGAHAVRSASKVVELMHRLAGTSGVYTRNRLERHFRDMQTLRHHGFASENRFETVGQVYLGVKPEFAMVAF